MRAKVFNAALGLSISVLVVSTAKVVRADDPNTGGYFQFVDTATLVTEYGLTAQPTAFSAVSACPCP